MTTVSGIRRQASGQQAAVPALVVSAVVGLCSVASACVPVPNDAQTRVNSCSPPAGSTKPCKTPVGAAPFPNATFVKGPSGSFLSAYVNGPGMSMIMVYDLVFAGGPQLENGLPCRSSASTVIGGPVFGNQDGGVSSTAGTIPANSPLGLGQICFTSVNRPQANTSTSSSTPAQFKVTI